MGSKPEMEAAGGMGWEDGAKGGKWKRRSGHLLTACHNSNFIKKNCFMSATLKVCMIYLFFGPNRKCQLGFCSSWAFFKKKKEMCMSTIKILTDITKT